MVDKRGHEDIGKEDPQSKRPRVEDGAAPAAAAAAPRVSAEMLEKLEKTKRLLQAQKELQEKLKKLPQVRAGRGALLMCAAAVAAAVAVAARLLLRPRSAGTRRSVNVTLPLFLPHNTQVAKPLGAAAAPAAAAPPAALAAATQRAVEIASKFGLAPTIRPPVAAAPAPAAAAAAAPGGFRPQPLRLDAMGREVDEFGNVIQRKVAPVSTLKVNQRPPEPPKIDPAAAAAAAAAAAELVRVAFVSLSSRSWQSAPRASHPCPARALQSTHPPTCALTRFVTPCPLIRLHRRPPSS